MGIYPPNHILSEAERELLYLLAQLIVNAPDGKHASNLAGGRVPLSDGEAHHLLHLLEHYLELGRVQRSAAFVEKVGSDERSSWEARELYLQGRAAAGRKRVAASWQWADFLQRLGYGSEPPPGHVRNPMSFGHFLDMEERLLRELGIHPRVMALVLQMLVDRRGEVEGLRSGRKKIRRGEVLGLPEKTAIELRGQDLDGAHSLPLVKVVALTTLTADFSVLFASRDWGVAGTISAMAAALPPMLA